MGPGVRASEEHRGDRPAPGRIARDAEDTRLHQAGDDALGAEANEQPFDAQTPAGVVRMVNVSATIPGPGTGRLIIAGHYDTKLFKEFDFVGANDAGSSTAFLIELARVLKGRTNAMPIELLFLDGEEASASGTPATRHGSRHYVAAARSAGTLAQIKAMILVDMIGEKRPGLQTREQVDAVADGCDLVGGAQARTVREFVTSRPRSRTTTCRSLPRVYRPSTSSISIIAHVAHRGGHARQGVREEPAGRRRRASRRPSGDRVASEVIGGRRGVSATSVSLRLIKTTV